MSAIEPDIGGAGIDILASPMVASLRRIAISSITSGMSKSMSKFFCQRHEVQVLLLAQLIPLVEDVIAHLTVPVEILTDNVGIALAETAQNLFV